jgi:hypothetical protein
MLPLVSLFAGFFEKTKPGTEAEEVDADLKGGAATMEQAPVETTVEKLDLKRAPFPVGQAAESAI